jgi:uncharacterized protein YeaO (DUF488 family)
MREVIKLKRVYDAPEPGDGKRVLVDRLWPRGLRKETARMDEWIREIAPSNGLRRWYGHKEERRAEFRRRYKQELRKGPAAKALQKLREEGKTKTVTLLFAATNGVRGNAAVLFEVLTKRM